MDIGTDIDKVRCSSWNSEQHITSHLERYISLTFKKKEIASKYLIIQ